MAGSFFFVLRGVVLVEAVLVGVASGVVEADAGAALTDAAGFGFEVGFGFAVDGCAAFGFWTRSVRECQQGPAAVTYTGTLRRHVD